MSVNSKGSGETELMPRLACAFTGRLSIKHPFLMCWLKYGSTFASEITDVLYQAKRNLLRSCKTSNSFHKKLGLHLE